MTFSPGVVTDRKSSASALIAEVVADRVGATIQQAGGSRVVYAMVDLGNDLTCAIGDQVSRLPSREGSRIEVAIHSSLQTNWIPTRLISDEAATWFRNHTSEGVAATLFSVPGQEMEQVIQSLGTVQRINHTWILDATKSSIWAAHALPSFKDTNVTDDLGTVLAGLMESGILASATMLAEFCMSIRNVMTGTRGFTLEHSISHSFPSLQLPRDCLEENEIKSLMKSPAVTIRRVRDRFRPYLYLTNKRGELRIRRDMLDLIGQLLENNYLRDVDAELLRDLARDKEITYGVWRPSQHRVASVEWARVRRFSRNGSR